MHAKIVAGKKVRYAVVGGGRSAKLALLASIGSPADSIIASLVTSDKKNANHLALPGRLPHKNTMQDDPIRTYSYNEYEQVLADASIDAVYLALPNFAHVDFAVRALDAGVHLLLDTPMAASVAQCERILAAARRSGAKLMVACGLSHRTALVEAVRGAQAGRIGEVRIFHCTCSRPVSATDHCASYGFWAGPIPAMAPSVLGTARSLFNAEPVRVSATGVCTDATRFHYDDTVSVTLNFPGDRTASFTLSYGNEEADGFVIKGSEGELSGQPATPVRSQRGDSSLRRRRHLSDQLTHFSECILKNRAPESDGEGGLLDVRIIAAIERSLRTGQPQTLDPYYRSGRTEQAPLEHLPQYAHFELLSRSEPAA